jgi:RNA polymerase subunit RPABC4/transcription elongation factor Spt4
MPTFKHPCPYCGKFIDRAVAACPYCSQPDPFAPKRCPNCRKIVDDPDWVTCPSCGQSLVAPPPGAAVTPGVVASAPPASGGPAPSPGTAAGAPASASPAPAPIERPPLYKDPDAPAPAPQMAGKCSGCGAPMPAGARFCTICGTMAAE